MWVSNLAVCDKVFVNTGGNVRFWDTAENRSVPRPAPKPHKAPGLLTQYLTGDPRFEPTEESTE